MKNNVTGQVERQLVLCKWTLVPLAIVPPIVPQNDSEMKHFSSPSVRAVNDKIAAFSYQAQSATAKDDFT